MDAFKQNRIIYVFQISILIWCFIVMSKYKIMVLDTFDAKYLCYIMLMYYIYQLASRFKENEQDRKRANEIEKEFGDLINSPKQER